MKTCRVVAGLRSREVGKPLIEALSRIYPEGGDGGLGFLAVLPEDDQRLIAIIEALRKAGLRPEPTGKWKAYAPGREYSLGRSVKYEEADFVTARYISCSPGKMYPQFDAENADDRDANTRLLSLVDTSACYTFAGSDANHLLVTDDGRSALDKDGFREIAYVPAYSIDERSVVQELRDLIAKGGTPDFGEPSLWEIRPKIVLPPMLPLAFTHTVNGEQRISRNPIDVDYRMAYAKVDLDKVGAFDFARPHPSEDSKQALVDPLVVSQRFFQFMKKQKNFDLSQWTPVREE